MGPSALTRLAVVALAATTCACELAVSVDGLTGGADASTGDARATDGTADAQESQPAEAGPIDSRVADSPADAALDSPPICSSGQTTCGSSCVTLSSDPNNCGACGHDCQGGGCTGGACSPVALATGQSSPWGLAVDGTGVYFTNDVTSGSVIKCGLSGCSASMTVIASNQNGADRIVLDPSNVYWTNITAGQVMACPLTGCPPGGPTVLATGQTQSPMGIAVDAQNVYWAESAGGPLLKCPLAGCATMAPVNLAQATNPRTLFLDGTNLLWVAAGGDVSACATSGCGGTPTTIASGQASPYFVVAYNGLVYWTNDSATGGGVFSCQETGCTTPVTLSSEPNPVGLAVDTSGVYWTTDQATGVVRMCPLSGCSGNPKTLATAQAYPFQIALDATSIYWTASMNGTVMKLAKPL